MRLADEPTFDSDGYPTEETLERIRQWPVNTWADAHAAMDFAGKAWSYPDRWRCQPRWRDCSQSHVTNWPLYRGTVRRYVFSTGGWSGNESIVAAIEANREVMLGAWSWQRGGHYDFRFPADEQEPGT